MRGPDEFSPDCCHSRCKGHEFCVYEVLDRKDKPAAASKLLDPNIVDHCGFGHPIYRGQRYCADAHYSHTFTCIQSGGFAPPRSDGLLPGR